MNSFKEWLAKPIKLKRKKERGSESRGDQNYGEGGDNHQQGKVVRCDTKIPQQTIHLFPVPEF